MYASSMVRIGGAIESMSNFSSGSSILWYFLKWSTNVERRLSCLVQPEMQQV